MHYQTNTQLQLASDFVQFTNQNIFLTGKAGTGKTTFLKKLKEESPKRMVVVAPTGVAAINAGGVTIHSFFQLSFGPQIPQDIKRASIGNPGTEKNISAEIKRFNKEKINIIRSLDLLVIDEISMVRADLLDSIDEVLRRFRNRNKPFGGVQLLMIGDLQQLSPIVKDEEWSILKNYYETCYFFSSRALLKSGLVPIELKHIFRQSDLSFIHLLNNVRENRMDEQTLSALNKRCIPNFQPSEDEGYITLTTHNYQSQKINNTKLLELSTSIQRFQAKVENDFPEYMYPTDQLLELKIGAQVMFVKNDSSYEKRYFNGKIGKVIDIDDEQIEVLCPDDSTSIMVSVDEWQNSKYSLNEKTQEIEEKVVGKFYQYPLKLAWSITIHKSQGLTFEKAIIDARQSFAHGQVYVALSRCKTLEGLVLSTPIENSSVKNDATVQGFSKHTEANQPDNKKLEESRKSYQLELLSELFDFRYLLNQVGYITKLLNENRGQVVGNLLNVLQIMQLPIQNDLIGVAEKFIQQLKNLTRPITDLEKSNVAQERVIKASHYFMEKLEQSVANPFHQSSFVSDNKTTRKVINEACDKLTAELEVKKICLEEIMSGFKLKRFIEIKSKAAIDKNLAIKKAKNKEENLGDLNYPNFYIELRTWRNDKASELNVTISRVLSQKTMMDIANELPASRDELKAIKGMGGTKLKQFGKDILSMVIAYRKMEGLEIPFGAENDITLAALSSHEISLKMFKDGSSVKQIAKSRNLAASTIESHLAQFVDSGELELDQLIDMDKLFAIKTILLKHPGISLADVRNKLGEDYTYWEVRLVMGSYSNT